jgi:hypothetical protein
MERGCVCKTSRSMWQFMSALKISRVLRLMLRTQPRSKK